MAKARAKDRMGGKGVSATVRQRALLADFCRMWRKRVRGEAVEAADITPRPSRASNLSRPSQDGTPPVAGSTTAIHLAPRLRQTLELLLAGDGEKQIAIKLELSRHTVHDYVKALYRRFGVGTRAELLALWVRR